MICHAFGAFAVLTVLLYLIRISIYLKAFLLRKKTVAGQEKHEELFVSLIIPFRNEEDKLSALLDDLEAINYPLHLFELIFVDDHSKDNSVCLIEERMARMSNILLIRLDDEAEGKKLALDHAIARARGEWIIQTDADCRLQPGFLASHSARASMGDVDLLAGPVMIGKGTGCWNMIESLEFLSLNGSGMASFHAGRPVMCNGANLSYSRAFYMQVREELLSVPSMSGDDIFLLSKVKQNGAGQAFIDDENSIVETAAAGSPGRFFRQRLRWGSKSKYYTDPDMIRLALLVWISNLALGVLFLMAVFVPGMLFYFLIAWGTKFIIDFLFLFAITRFYKQQKLMMLYPLTSLFYYFYISFAGLISLVWSVNWKGRRNEV